MFLWVLTVGPSELVTEGGGGVLLLLEVGRSRDPWGGLAAWRPRRVDVSV